MEEGAPICRWVVAGIRTDIMPIDPGILGFTNVWYAGAMDHPAVIAGPDGNLRILDAPHFCATKLEAFAARGDGDYLHRDVEDFIAVIDGRSTLIDEIACGAGRSSRFRCRGLSGLMATQAFVDDLPGHLEGDAGSQARLPCSWGDCGESQPFAQHRRRSDDEPKPRTAILVAPRASVPAPGCRSRYLQDGYPCDRATSEPCSTSPRCTPSASSFIRAASTSIQPCRRQSSRACSARTPLGDTTIDGFEGGTRTAEFAESSCRAKKRI